MVKGSVIEGQRNPARQAAQNRQLAVAQVRGKHKGKKIDKLTSAEQRDLLLLMAIALGFADEEGSLL